MNTNFFIAIEGIDGSGKSTQVKLLQKLLANSGLKVQHEFEPTDSNIGRLIRNIFSGKEPGNQYTIAALFAADRLDHILNSHNGLKKKISEGYAIICDRFYLSSYAYHSVHVPMDWVIDCNKMAVQLLKPHLHIFIDVPPQLCMQRLQQSRPQLEMYETLTNLQAVYDMYKLAIEKLKHQENIFVVDGTLATDQISKLIFEELKRQFNF